MANAEIRPALWSTTIAAAALSAMLAPLNSTMIVVALPELLHEFRHSLAWGSWIVTSYLVAMATVQPLAGSLGDRYGRRRLMLAGLILFLAATVVAALAPSVEVLLLARTLQAVAGAVAIPNGIALVRALIPEERQGRAAGTIGAGIAIAAGLGPPLGGIITDALGWRWIFAANVLLLVPALLLVALLPRDLPGDQRRGFDLASAALLMSTLVSLVLALTIWRLPGRPATIAPVLGLVALVTGIALWRHLHQVDRPLVNLGLFRAPGYTPAVLAILLSNLAMYTLLLSLPIFLVRRAGWSPSRVGFLLAGLSLQMIVFSPLGGRLADTRGRRLPATIGALLTLIGMVPLLSISLAWSWPVYLSTLVLIGVGLGLAMAPVQASAVLAVPASMAGQASGLFSTMRYFGSITGSTLLAAIIGDTQLATSHFRLLYAVLLLAAAGAVLASSRLPGPAATPAPFEAAPGQLVRR